MSGIQILLAIIGILTTSYITGAIIKSKSIPESISETSYIWETNCDHKQWHKAHLFSIYCCLVAGLMFWPWIKITPEYWQFICFLGCAGIMMAGVTPFFKDKYQSLIHYFGGAIIALSWISWMLIMQQYMIIVGGGLTIGVCCIVRPKSWVFWFEVVGLLALIYCIWAIK